MISDPNPEKFWYNRSGHFNKVAALHSATNMSALDDAVVIIFVRVDLVAAIRACPVIFPVHDTTAFRAVFVISLAYVVVQFAGAVGASAVLRFVVYFVAIGAHLHVAHLLRL